MILSVSRRTDIPAFYSDWFFSRCREGFLYVRNPMNPTQISNLSLSPDVVDCIVFWSKNPSPMLPRLNELRNYQYYFQYTLNAYGRDVEPKVPPIDERVSTFRTLAEKIGKERVIWRYDPIIFSSRYTVSFHLERFAWLANALKGYTEKCVFSFVDIYPAKNQSVLQRMAVSHPTESDMETLLEGMTAAAGKAGIALATCAEAIDMERWGIGHNSCIDQSLIERITGAKIKAKPDGQRPHCRCIQCNDVGSYGTCPHGCVYCYANSIPAAVAEKSRQYDPASPMLCDTVNPAKDRITIRPVKSLRLPPHYGEQLSLF